MSYIKLAVASVLTLALVGCARHNSDYLRQSQTTHPIVVPANVAVKPMENYYAIPNVPTRPVTQSPSMQPPGSNLQRFKSVKVDQPPLMTQPTTLSSAQLPAAAETVHVSETLTVAGNVNQAWVKVGKALHQTPYQIMDQDPSMDSYYILDVASTNNQITKSTPIYRVYLKAAGDKTQVLLLDQANQPAASAVARRVMASIQQKIN